MRKDYPDGSFSLGWEYARGWYDADGTLVDCAKYYWRKGQYIEASIPTRWTKVRQWLQEQGTREVALLNRGILKRH